MAKKSKSSKIVKQSVDQMLDEAVQCHESGKLDDAQKLYLKVIESQPNNDLALHGLGAIASVKNDNKTAISKIKQAISINDRNPVYYSNLASTYCKNRNYKEAVQACQMALKLNPNYAPVYNTLGMCYVALKQNEHAAKAFSKAVELNPNYIDAYLNMGDFALRLGDRNRATRYYVRALNVNKKSVKAHLRLARMYTQQEDFAIALAHYNNILHLLPGHPAMLFESAMVLRELKRVDEAIERLEQAVAKAPNQPMINQLMGYTQRERGNIDEAVKYFRKAVASKPTFGIAWSNLIHSSRKHENAEEDIKAMKQALANDKVVGPDRRGFNFALGRIYHDMEQWDESFKYYEAANKDMSVKFDPDKYAEKLAEEREYFDKKYFKRMKKKYGSDSDVPVIIVGMPRSGTSLVEQVITSHDKIGGAGELREIPIIAAQLPKILESDKPYPQCLDDMSKEQAERIAKRYMNVLTKYADDGDKRVVDKLPGNFARLGLVATLLPNAKIIHCRRHPLDVALACYFQHFDRSAMNYTSQLEMIGKYYNQYKAMMDHWEQVLPIRIHTVDYEDMVTDTKREAKKLIKYLGLSWDKKCLQHDKNDRIVQTASSWQVRQPIYTSSVGKWKHYEKYLDELKKVVGFDK